MKVFGRVLTSLILVAGAAGCGPVYQTSYEMHPPNSEEGRYCVRECHEDQHSCSRHCEHETDRCRDRARDQARREYYRYVDDRREHGKKVERDEDSFYNDYQCDPQACINRCDGGFRQCFGTCGGTVIPHTVCTSGCDKAR